MSYILEALKKAQAERQLGSTPTIHAAPVAPAVTPGAAVRRKPLLLGVAAGALLAAIAIFAWRQHASAPAAPAASARTDYSAQLAAAPQAPAAAPAPAAAAAPAPAAVAGPAPTAAVAPGPASAGAPAPSAVAAPTLAVAAASAAASDRALAAAATRAPAAIAILPARPAPSAAAAVVPAPTHKPAARAPIVSAPTPVHTQPPAPVTENVREAPAPVANASAPAAEDSVGPLSALPEAIRNQVPKVTFGGYLYSPNPADRLLLVDKALRHEGEEVAPGLLLEKLLPKAAVMNYKGYRYRVAY